MTNEHVMDDPYLEIKPRGDYLHILVIIASVLICLVVYAEYRYIQPPVANFPAPAVIAIAQTSGTISVQVGGTCSSQIVCDKAAGEASGDCRYVPQGVFYIPPEEQWHK